MRLRTGSTLILVRSCHNKTKANKIYSNRSSNQGNPPKTQQRQQAAPLVQQQESYVAFASREKIKEEIQTRKNTPCMKTISPGTWYHVFIPPTLYSSRMSSSSVSTLQRFACFGVIKYLILNNIWFFVYNFPKKSIATTRNCRLFCPWAVR